MPILLRGSICIFDKTAIVRCYRRCGWEGRRVIRGMRREEGRKTWVRGNTDICQEIDNSNKLVAKHSNRLPNGTIAHSNPRLWAKHRISLPRQNDCTYVRGSDASTTDTIHILLVHLYSPHRWTDYERICWAILFRPMVESCRQFELYLLLTTIREIIMP